MSSYIQRLRADIGSSLLMVPGVAAVILDSQQRLLLQEKENEAWSLPTGAIEPGETPKQAVIREVCEETGLMVVPTRVIGLFGGEQFRYRYPNGDLVEYTIALMRCEVVGDIGIVTDSETRSLRYFEKGALPELALPYPDAALFDECGETLF